MGTWKDAVRVATTGMDITLSGLQTIDGVALAENDRVLVKDQTATEDNGIYEVASGGWVRAADANSSTLMGPETKVRAAEGSINAHTEWALTTQAPITLGETALTFIKTQNSWKDVVRLASAGRDLGLSGLSEVDGVTPADGDRILVKDQVARHQNGIYIAHSGPWARASDTATTIEPEMIVQVSEGSANAHSQWRLDTPAPIVVGETALNYVPTPSVYVINPKNFGCPMDGVNDDYPGFRALLDSLPTYPNHASVTVQLPPGEMWLSRSIRINRPINLRGSGPASYRNAGTTINFAPGSGFIIDDTRTDPAGNNGSGSYFENFHLRSRQLTISNPVFGGLFYTDTRKPSKKYALGDVAIPYNLTPTRANTRKLFRVTTAGATAGTPNSGTDPAGFATATPGTTVADGTVIWTCESVPQDYSSYATPGDPSSGPNSYAVGDRVFKVGECRYYWECVVAGTTKGDGIVPFPDEPNIEVTQADGTITWALKIPAGIFCRTGEVTFKNLFIFGFTGAAIHVQGDGAVAPKNIADFGLMSDVHFGGCGMGIVFKGFDAQGWTVINCEGTLNPNGVQAGGGDQRTFKDSTVGYGCHGFLDRSLGNTYLGCYYQGAGGIGFYADRSGSTYLGCRSESRYKNQLKLGNLFLAANSVVDMAGGGTWLMSKYGANIEEVDRTGAKELQAGLGAQDGMSTHWFHSQDDGSLNVAWRYQAPADVWNPAGQAGPGWWTLGYGPGHWISTVGYSGVAAPEGPGHWRTYLGSFEGSHVTGIRYRGVDIRAITNQQLRGGRQVVGDKFFTHSSGIPGSWNGWTVATAGYRGTLWRPNALYLSGNPAQGRQRSTVEPKTNAYPIPKAGEKCFRVHSGPLLPRSGSTASITTVEATSYGSLMAITGITGLSSADTGRFLVISGAATSANNTAATNGAFLISQVDLKTGSVTVFGPAGAAGPDANNGSIRWQLYDVVGQTGQTEPNWNSATTPGDLITDNKIVWVYLGTVPTYNPIEYVDDPVYAITPQTRTRWRDTAATNPTTAAPKTKVDGYRVSLQTTTNTADQVLLTTDPLTDNSCSVIDVTITGKKTGNFNEAVSAKLSGAFYRNAGGAPSNIPPNDNTVKGTASLAGSTFSLFVSGNTIQVRCTPGASVPIDWGLNVTVTEGKS